MNTKPKPCKVTLKLTKDAVRVLNIYAKLLDIGNFNIGDTPKIADIDMTAIVNFALYHLFTSHKAIEGYLNLSLVNSEIADELLNKYNINAKDQQHIIVDQLHMYNRALRKHDEEFIQSMNN